MEGFLMSDASRRHQQKVERKKRKEKKRKLEVVKREQRAQDKKNAAVQRAFQTTAYAWPIRYRKLFFDKLPKISPERIDLTGLDLHLKWYPTQEARDTDSEGEVISALSIESCERVPSHVIGNGIELRCRGRLAEQISPDSVYGQWARLQPLDSFEGLDGEEFRERDVEFSLQLKVFDARAGKKLEGLFARFDGLDCIPGVYNVWFIKFPEEFRLSAPALQIDRLTDLLFMLRLVIPRSLRTAEDTAAKVRVAPNILERALAAERNAADALKIRADATRAALAVKPDVETHPAVLEVEALEEEVRPVREKEARQKAAVEAIRAELAALRYGPELRDRQRLIDAQGVHRRTAIHLAELESKLTAAIQRVMVEVKAPIDAFYTAMEAEFDAAGEFTRAFYKWMQIHYELEHA